MHWSGARSPEQNKTAIVRFLSRKCPWPVWNHSNVIKCISIPLEHKHELVGVFALHTQVKITLVTLLFVHECQQQWRQTIRAQPSSQTEILQTHRMTAPNTDIIITWETLRFAMIIILIISWQELPWLSYITFDFSRHAKSVHIFISAAFCDLITLYFVVCSRVFIIVLFYRFCLSLL